ncbi:MAG: hypothetical protein WBO04_02065 [Steroidobacteraceae bacterium]
MRLDLPARLLADRAAMLLIATFAIVAEVVLLRQPGGPTGPGIATGLLLAAWQVWRLRPARQLRGATLEADGGWRLAFGDGRTAPAQLVRGSRLLGSSTVLKWTVEGHPLAVWLTPADLSRAALRALHVRLAGASLQDGT